ncbi:MAG: HAD superfamily hydrolase (TIGR01459 family) [Pseudomonadales bacterium]|jgi:HAD superfamily hydrolase (TIGR01459 family)
MSGYDSADDARTQSSSEVVQLFNETPWTKLQSLDDIASAYNVFLIDQFGVLLHATGAYPQAPDALRQLAKRGHRIVLLSNSGKRAEPNIQRLLSLGFDRASFETVLSSGEVAYRHITAQIGQSLQPGTPVLVIAEHADVYLDGLALQSTCVPSEAKLILIAGSDPRYPELESYRTMLAPLADRGVPCLCTNPDIKRLSEHGTTFAPGAVARLYETLGGRVQWIGKPYPLMYATACEMLGHPEPLQVVCIGDSPAHDIAGGQGAGYKTALVTSGIHADESLDSIKNRCQQLGVQPDHVMRRFDFAS